MRWYVLLICLTLSHCFHAASPPAPYPLLRPEPQLELLHPMHSADLEGRERVVATARQLLSRKEYKVGDYLFDTDQVGFIRAAFWSAGRELINANIARDAKLDGMTLLFRSVAAEGHLHRQTPRAGDLVFFDQGDAEATHPDTPVQVAIVEQVSADGTISALGVFANGAARITFNLRHPTASHKNDVLTGTENHLAAELFRTFADPY